MERIIQMFKQYDREVLENKKKIVVEELQKSKELYEKLSKLVERIDKAIEELNYINYDSD